MNYQIFIDESGTLNDLNQDHSIFSVSLVIFPKEYTYRLKNYFKRNVKNFKKEFKIPLCEELKAHDFVKKDQVIILYEYVKKIKFLNNYSGFIFNKNINPKWLINKNVTYNFIIKCVLQRILERMNIKTEDEIEIITDIRELNTGSFNSLSDYLISEFVLTDKIKKINVTASDSKVHWGVQLADWFSYINYDEAKNKQNMSNKRIIY